MRIRSNNILLKQGFTEPLLSPLQNQVDGLVGSFTDKATDGPSLAAMVAGGTAFRLARVGVMGFGGGAALRIVSLGAGLATEVSAFEFTHRGLSSVFVGGNSNLWRWAGHGGLAQGLSHSFITFGTLRGMAPLTRGQNLPVQHLMQSTAMVVGHQAAGALGIGPVPHESLAEQFLNAEAANLHISAGLALAHRLAPGVHALERGLDLSLRVPDSNFVGGETPPLQGRWQPAFPSGLPSSRPEGKDPKLEGLLFSKMHQGPGGPRFSLEERGLGPETPLEERLREGPTVPVEEIPAAIDRLIKEIPAPISNLKMNPGEGDYPPLMMTEGKLRYRRLEALHRLLLGGKDPKDAQAVDNAPGHFIETFLSLARMGSRVVVKDPGDLFFVSQEFIRALKLPELSERLTFCESIFQIDLPTPSDVVYWTHPALHNLVKPPDVSLGDYLGRDVKPGGYLVIQSDHLLGTHKKLLKLKLDPDEWDSVYNSPLPSNILPTVQTMDLHLQVYRRKDGPSVTRPPEKIEASVIGPAEVKSESLEFPYVQGEGGVFLPRPTGGTVAVLGDMSGKRLYQLASRGHPVIYMDYDPGYLMDTETNVGNHANAARSRGDLKGPLDITFLARNWFNTSLQADWVEAFYPWDFRDLPLEDSPERTQAFRFFLDQAIHTKLKPTGGGAFIVSEHWESIADLADVILADPRLELLETVYQERRSLIAGGYGFSPSPNMLSSWLIYRRK